VLPVGSSREPVESCDICRHIALESDRDGAAMDISLSILMILAGLMGAGGVALAAASAHGKPGTGLDYAGYQLLLHAPAVMAGIAALDRGLISRPLGILALAGFVLGSTLFAGDLALRAFAGRRLFAMAAPSGGAVLIAAWLLLAAAALAAMFRS